ncbi:hypothetical protein GCM10022409_00840 [Hymenobacter glaciei]|uniref:Uncharacterized protein n=2 Tax=Hymenobacter glaciei TaxID=877209 RepID=A0ABP7T5K1_9BACT
MLLTGLARVFPWLAPPTAASGAAPIISRRIVKLSLAWQLALLVPSVVLNLNREVVLLVLALASFVVPLGLLLLANRRNAL